MIGSIQQPADASWLTASDRTRIRMPVTPLRAAVRNGSRSATAGEPVLTSSFAIGVDGMHSTVRRYVAGDVAPVYSGEIGFRGVIPTAACPNLPTPTELHVWCGP